ncbi:MAG: hypothetical protein NWR67_13620 [Saprospiraceae bacterium]|jgi:muconolactone delta-isomerase|nr:hypothetical protein [Saprospiraceae bacterium]MDP4822044.1 hypothetical protein [Saprospiraceae bacterium]MDP4999898.1 hypothetical protein [Saprospiraceae bacterium]
MDSPCKVFMVTLQLQPAPIEQFVQLLPYQQTVIQRFTAEGKLLHYALSLDSHAIWMVFHAEDPREIPHWITSFPICRACQWQIHPLQNFNIPQKKLSSSLN